LAKIWTKVGVLITLFLCHRSGTLSWCRAVVDDVGDHAMPEHSVFKALMSCIGFTVFFHDAHKLSRYFSLMLRTNSKSCIFHLVTAYKRQRPLANRYW